MAPLDEVCAARLPAASLAALAPLRCRPEVRVTVTGEAAWVCWPAGNGDVVRRLLPVPGVELFVRRDGRWLRWGSRLPSFDLPDGDGPPLSRVLTPAPFQAEPAGDAPLLPARLRLVPVDQFRETSGMVCRLAPLATWADDVSGIRLASIRGAIHGEDVLLRGRNLPLLPAAERYWGEEVLRPLGWDVEPALPEAGLRELLGAADGEMLVFRPEGIEAVPGDALQPLTRAGIRQAMARR